MNIVVADAGNSIIKGKSATNESSYPHAFLELGDIEYQQALSRSGDAHPDYMRINGVPYVVGESAMIRGFSGRQHGAARYTREYYGVMVAASMFRIYDKSMKNIMLYGSHAPQDLEFRADMKIATEGMWEVECQREKRIFDIKTTYCFDEPIGGLMNVLLSRDGTAYQRTDLRNGEVLVLDTGGHTVDAVIMSYGKVDYSSARSIEDGVLRVEEIFKKSLVNRYRDVFHKSSPPKSDRVREAIRTGKYRAGGYGSLDCKEQADDACELLVNSIYNLYIQYGGKASYEYVMLTGGGSGLLESRIRERLNHSRVILAERQDEIHLANVRGGMKMMRLFESQGALR